MPAPTLVRSSSDPDVTLYVPENDVADPELSIVIPALNEQLTIEDFVAWCHEGMKKAGVRGEILIIDSGQDRTTELALAGGARVLKTPKRGLGRAYLDALPHIRGKYVLMGDCDCTYDFRELAPFVEKFRGGAEFVMGSRFRGYIEPGSMPPLHRYLGTPVTTWILNVIFSGHFSDIHCGMRGISRAALERMDLRSQSWEYASEMVLKSVHMKLRTEEVPIRFLKDRDGRLSHHKRSGWFSPWQAAWINLRAMFVYGADFFLYKPGLLLLLVGLALTLGLSLGEVKVGPVTFSLHWMWLGVSLAVLGLQCVYMGILAGVLRLRGHGGGQVVPALLVYARRRGERGPVRRGARLHGDALGEVPQPRPGARREGVGQSPGRDGPVLDDGRVHDVHVHAHPARHGGGRASEVSCEMICQVTAR